MADFDFNLLDDRAQVYDSFVELKSGGDFYRFKSLQSSEPKFVWPNIDRIGDDGTLALTPDISKHRYDQRIVLTTSEVDTVHPPTNTRTISYFIYQRDVLRNLVTASVSIVYVAKDAPSLPNMRLDFDYVIEEIGTPRINGDGDVFVDTAGRIIPGTIQFIRD